VRVHPISSEPFTLEPVPFVRDPNDSRPGRRYGARTSTAALLGSTSEHVPQALPQPAARRARASPPPASPAHPRRWRAASPSSGLTVANPRSLRPRPRGPAPVSPSTTSRSRSRPVTPPTDSEKRRSRSPVTPSTKNQLLQLASRSQCRILKKAHPLRGGRARTPSHMTVSAWRVTRRASRLTSRWSRA